MLCERMLSLCEFWHAGKISLVLSEKSTRYLFPSDLISGQIFDISQKFSSLERPFQMSLS